MSVIRRFSSSEVAVLLFTLLYVAIGGWYFLQDLNHEFVIYVLVIVGIFALVYGTLHITRFPSWLLALLSFWGLLHVLGGAVVIDGGVLFGYRIYPFLDRGGEFYILKYDQVVHAYLYGITTLFFLHLLRHVYRVVNRLPLALFIASMASLGVSALNEIMEFFVAITLERNGVGGYENAMLDLIFNIGGAIIVSVVFLIVYKLKRSG